MKKRGNNNFDSDCLRMTGKRYTGSISDGVNIFLKHNLRFMWWYRKQEVLPKIFCSFLMWYFSRKYGIEIQTKKIGKGLYLGHPYNITVGGNVIIGKYCSLHKGCTIGAENRGRRAGAPVLGDRVYIGINATVVGNIHIGNDVLIAPNSFVNFDVPDHSVVLGNPATVHHKVNATKGYIAFCDEDYI